MPCYAINDVVPVIEQGAFVHPLAVVIGDVLISTGCYVGPGACLRGDFGRIVLLAGANVQDTCVLHGFPGKNTVVEENGHIGHGAVLHGCVVQRNAMIGMNAVVMDEAVIGEGAIVAACAFVPAGMHIPARSLAVGTPAKVKRELTPDELASKLKGTLLYQELARRSLGTMVEVEPLRPDAGSGRVPDLPDD